MWLSAYLEKADFDSNHSSVATHTVYGGQFNAGHAFHSTTVTNGTLNLAAINASLSGNPVAGASSIINAYGLYFSNLNEGVLSGGSLNIYGVSMPDISTASTLTTGVNIGNISGTAAATGLTIGNLTGLTTDVGISIGSIGNGATAAAATGISIGTIGNNTGGIPSTATGLSIGGFIGTAANYGISIGSMSAAGSANNFGIDIGQINTQLSTTAAAIHTAGFAGSGTATYGINLGTNASTATTNYGINIGAISGAGTTNYGLYVGAVSGATNNYAAIFAAGNVGIGTTGPGQLLDLYHGNLLLDNTSGQGIRAMRPSDSAQNNILFEQNGGSGYLLADATVLGSVGNSPIQLLPNSGANQGVTILSGGNVGIGSSSPAVSLDLSPKTDAISLPSGTSAQRPTGANGMIRFNSTVPQVEAYYSDAWNALGGGGSSTITLGTSASATNPQRNGQAGTGLFSAVTNTVSIAANSVDVADFTTTGESVTGSVTASTTVISPIHTGSGAIAIKPGSDSTTAVQVQTSGGTNILNIDTTNSRLGIGTATPGTELDINGGVTMEPVSVTLSANNTVLTTANRSYFQVTSNNTTATNRIFCLGSGTVGQIVTVEWTSSTDKGVIIDGGNCGGATGAVAAKIGANWGPNVASATIQFVYNGTNWIVLGRPGWIYGR